MSRIGKKPIPIPAGVDVSLEASSVSVKGPKGTLALEASDLVEVTVKDSMIIVSPRGTDKKSRMMWGTTRSLLDDMVTGVSKGFSRTLELSGVTYRVQLDGRKLKMTLGYSHPVEFDLPEGIEAEIDDKDRQKTKITLTGIEKEKLGQAAAEIKGLRPVEPYKGKGFSYAGERVRRKAGKTMVK